MYILSSINIIYSTVCVCSSCNFIIPKLINLYNFRTLEAKKRERNGAGDVIVEAAAMRKYYRMILFIFLFLSTISLLFYWHEYNRLRYVLEVLNFFGQPPEVAVTPDCLLNTSLFSTENVTIPDSVLPVWHRLGNDLFVFSAFWEVVGKKEHVKTIGVARFAATLKLGCRLWYEGHEFSSEGRISHSFINMKVNQTQLLSLTKSS